MSRSGVPGRLRRRIRGFSMMEVVVAAALGAIFAGAVGAAVASTSNMAQVSIERGRMNTEVRQITDLAVRYLRGARPTARCLLPSAATPFASCRRVVESGPAVVYASANEVWFYSYVGASSGSALPPPDCVQITFTAGRMDVTRFWPTATATYTAPVWVSTAETVRSVAAPAVAAPLQFYTAGGDPIPVTSPIGTRSCTLPAAPDARLSQISMVRISARASSTRSGAGTVELNAVAELPSTRFRGGS